MISITDVLKIIDTIPKWKQIKDLPERLEGITQRVKALEKENAEFKKQHTKTAIQQPDPPIPQEFVEHHGAFFKRKPGDGYHLAVYCPVCHISTSSFENTMPYYCSKCGWQAVFDGLELKTIMQDLPE